MNKVNPPSRVALLVTCLVDVFRPQIGVASVTLLERAGCSVSVPIQTCCGQPNYNAGDRESAKQSAKKIIQTFETFDYVVVPSGSCAGMIGKHYPSLFSEETAWENRAEQLAKKTYELTSFLTDVLGVKTVTAEYPHRVTYHDSCSSLRELGIQQQPRLLLNSVRGLLLCELQQREACCGFGGTFCVKYPAISDKIVSDKVRDVLSTAAGTVVAGDLGCLMNIAGKLQREGHAIQVFHVAEVLANLTDKGIGA